MNTYITSDLHIGHDRPWIVQARGFNSVEEHDSFIKNQLANLDADELWVVGDFFMGQNKSERMKDFVDSLHYDVRLILGNHDPKPEKCFGFKSVDYSIRVDGFQFAHAPAVFTDRHDREKSGELAKFQAVEDRIGGVVVHGHTHSKDIVSFTPNTTLQIHVGWDAWRRPVSWDEIMTIEKAYT